MSLFFSLLPTDVHVDVFYVWINAIGCGKTLLQVLSAMDIACSKTTRTSWRALLSQLPPFGECQLDDGVQCSADYLTWLDSRKVPVKHLLLSMQKSGLEHFDPNSPALMLPTIDKVILRDAYSLPIDLLRLVFRSCPHITSLECDHAAAFSDEIMTHISSLRSLTVTNSASGSSVLSMLDNCSQLRELRLTTWSLTDFIATRIISACPLLTRLEIIATSSQCVLKLLQGCPHLQDLVLHGLISETDFAAIITVPQIKRMACPTYPQTYQPWNIFTRMLEMRPDLDYLQFRHCEYSRQDCSFRLGSCWTAALLQRVFNTRITVFALLDVQFYFDNDAAEVIAQCLRGRLTALTVTLGDHQQLQIVLHACGPSLKSLGLTGDCDTSDIILGDVAASCPNLESLVVQPVLVVSTIHDEGLSLIFSRCPHLKILELYSAVFISVRTLEAILDLGLRMTRLLFCDCPLLEHHRAIWFRQQAMELQLLPVPDIVVRDS